jgi:hypothetical protein
LLRKEPDLKLFPAVREIFAPVIEENGFELLPEEKQISYQTSVVAQK